MTEADGVRAMLNQATPHLNDAAANGAIASRELTEALLYIGMAAQKLVSAREFAEKESDAIDGVLTILNLIFGTTLDDPLRVVISELEKTSLLLSNFTDRIGYKVDDLNMMSAVIKSARGEQELYASGESLLRATTQIEEYRDRL